MDHGNGGAELVGGVVHEADLLPAVLLEAAEHIVQGGFQPFELRLVEFDPGAGVLHFLDLPDHVAEGLFEIAVAGFFVPAVTSVLLLPRAPGLFPHAFAVHRMPLLGELFGQGGHVVEGAEIPADQAAAEGRADQGGEKAREIDGEEDPPHGPEDSPRALFHRHHAVSGQAEPVDHVAEGEVIAELGFRSVDDPAGDGEEVTGERSQGGSPGGRRIRSQGPAEFPGRDPEGPSSGKSLFDVAPDHDGDGREKHAEAQLPPEFPPLQFRVQLPRNGAGFFLLFHLNSK